MKRSILLLALILSVILMGCGEVKEEGTLYTEEDIFIDCIKIDYPDSFTQKTIIIEDENALSDAIKEFPKLESMPRFEEIVENYPIDAYIYVVNFIETGYESETITCDGIVVDKEDETIRFKVESKKDRNDIAGAVAGYITYAVFPKEELAGLDFSEQPYVLYPGR